MKIRGVFAPKYVLSAWLLIVVTLTETLAAGDNVYGLTRFDVKKVEHRWIIENYSHNNMAFGKCLKSPLFWGEDSKNVKWQLELCPKGYSNSAKSGVALYLSLFSKQIEVTADVQLSIINKSNTKASAQKFKHKYTRPQESRGYHNFISQSNLENYYKGSLLPDDKLTLAIDISFSTGMIRVADKCSSISYENCTSLPFESTFENDVTLLVDGEYLNAHKAALIAHSTWLANEFDFYPAHYSIELPYDIKADAMKEALRFIYTGKVDETNQDMLKKLLVLSNRLGMKHLKLYCEELLCKSMTPANVDSILELAQNSWANELLHEAKNYKIALGEKITK